MSRYNKIPQLRPEEIEFVHANYKNTSVPEMAKTLKRSASTLYSYMQETGLEPFKNTHARYGHSHPFRKANRRLESVVLQRKIENRTTNKK